MPYNILMKNKNIDEMDLHQAIRYLEKKHNCVIYGLLDMESLDHDLSFHDLGVRNLSKVSRQEYIDAMEYAVDAHADVNTQEYLYMVGMVADYLIHSHTPNPMNHLGGYSSKSK